MGFEWRIKLSEDLGARIREVMNESHIQGQDIAKTLGIDGGNFSKILRGTGSLTGNAYVGLYTELRKSYEPEKIDFMLEYVPKIALPKPTPLEHQPHLVDP
jgi:hypothetical protein